MTRKIIASAVVLLAFSAGIAYAATQLSSSDGTQVCVNNTNGLMRVASTCRDGEYPLTIGGGGGNISVTQNGTFTVPAEQTVGKALPLTGITVSGSCAANEYGIVADGLLQAASGKTMDAFVASGIGPGAASTVNGSSLLIDPIAATGNPLVRTTGGATVVATSNGATATITIGGKASDTDCTFLRQAVEAPTN